jgi:hypothetical protein
MTYCDQCGSASIDKDGFCGGCGAHYSIAQLGEKNKANASPAKAEISQLSQVQFPNMQLAQPSEKRLWLAILLATFVGPFGLAYCTLTGAVVMIVVAIAFRLFLGLFSAALAWLICILWAWYAVKRGSDGWTLW